MLKDYLSNKRIKYILEEYLASELKLMPNASAYRLGGLSDVDILTLLVPNSKISVTLRYGSASQRFDMVYDYDSDRISFVNKALFTNLANEEDYHSPLKEEIVRIVNSFPSHIRDGKINDILS
jgi:hypothetical protein